MASPKYEVFCILSVHFDASSHASHHDSSCATIGVAPMYVFITSQAAKKLSSILTPRVYARALLTIYLLLSPGNEGRLHYHANMKDISTNISPYRRFQWVLAASPFSLSGGDYIFQSPSLALYCSWRRLILDFISSCLSAAGDDEEILNHHRPYDSGHAEILI